MGELFVFLQSILDISGIFGVFIIGLAAANFLQWRTFSKFQKSAQEREDEIRDRWLKDLVESRDKYLELTQNLEHSLDLITKIVRKNNGSGNA